MTFDWSQVVLATGNRGKAQEFALAFGRPMRSLFDGGHVTGADECGATYADNARLKAEQAARALGRWALGDDTGLEVEALAGAPGLHTARFAGPQATAAENRARLLAALEHCPDSARQARFVCHLCLVEPSGQVMATASGSCAGRIRTAPAGEAGFGYDALFEVVEYHGTLAELGPAAKAVLSHRARAIQALQTAVARLAGG